MPFQVPFFCLTPLVFSLEAKISKLYEKRIILFKTPVNGRHLLLGFRISGYEKNDLREV
jgi:hypothetical protein